MKYVFKIINLFDRRISSICSISDYMRMFYSMLPSNKHIIVSSLIFDYFTQRNKKYKPKNNSSYKEIAAKIDKLYV